MRQKIKNSHTSDELFKSDKTEIEHHCRQCDKTKPKAEFYQDHATGKIRKPCIACRLKKQKLKDVGSYQRNPAAAKAKAKRWQERNPDKVRELGRKGMMRHRRRQREAGTPTFQILTPPAAATPPPTSPSASAEGFPTPKTQAP